MTDYTPTTEAVRNSYASWSDAYPEFDRWLAEVKAQEREACVNHVKFLYCSHSMEHKPYQEAVDDIVEVLTGKEDGSEVFEKWLAEVKAQAWEEGWCTGRDVWTDRQATAEDMNPYRHGEK